MRQTLTHILPFLLLFATRAALAGFLDESAEMWDNSTNSIQMALAASQSIWSVGDDPEFQIAFRNAGENDYFLNLGITLANGKRHFPTAISLWLVDANGYSRDLQLSGPPFIAGRVDIYAVGLGAKSLHVLKVKLSEFWSPATHEFKMALPMGHYKITARFQGNGATHTNTGMDWTAWNFWEGALESRVVEFDIQEPK